MSVLPLKADLMGPKKLALWFLIISVSISAALGIIAILTGNFGEFEVRIILTTLTISAASICALAAGALWESQNRRVMPAVSGSLAIFAALLLISGIWLEPSAVGFWKFTATISVFAAATAQACLVSLAQLAPRFKWIRVAALGAIFLLAILITIVIWDETGEERIFRAMGALGIIVAALTIMMPIFHRLSRTDLVASNEGIDSTDQRLFPTVLCPRCGMTRPNSPAEITCTSCGCHFVVTIIGEAAPAKQI